jgi:hypothetical protein
VQVFITFAHGLRTRINQVTVATPGMQTEFMPLAIYNKPRLNLKEVCEAIGMSMKTAYNQRSANTFPIAMSGDPLHADIRDVAAYLDKLRTPVAATYSGPAGLPGQRARS